jgi:porin
VGAWFISGRFADPLYDSSGLSLAAPASSGVPLQHQNDQGVYGIVDQMLWRRPGTDDQGIGMFLEVMAAPDDRNLSNLFIAAGLNWKAPLPARENDVLGIAATYQGISPYALSYSRDLAILNHGSTVYAASETSIELTYQYQVAPWLTLQPDAQYVINPGAYIPTARSPRPQENCFITGLRVTITF